MISPEYHKLASELQAQGLISDPWILGSPRFSLEPLLLQPAELSSLYDAAERLAEVFQELCVLAAQDPSLVEEFLGLTPYQRLMWRASAPCWHGFARIDLFFTRDGVVSCELNCDTPSGQPEATLLNAALHSSHQTCDDPNASLGESFCQMLAALAAQVLGRRERLTIGLVYPTEYTEDLALIELYRRWLEPRGHRVVLGSPYNLQLNELGGVSLFDSPCDVILRHYKTDWWGERLPVYQNEDGPPDSEPLEQPLGDLLGASLRGKVVVLNPFGAVLPQNKRAMAFLWEHISRFSPLTQETIHKHLPETRRLEDCSLEQLIRERGSWVIKSDYGCEGDEVLIGREHSDEEWASALRSLLPNRWVAQRYFEALQTQAEETTNFGVYLIAGRARGILVRRSTSHTDPFALIVPAFVSNV